MKKSKKLLLTALSVSLVMSASSAVALTAFADEATKDHEFNAKNDAVFEDFDRDNLGDTVKAGTGVNLGEKPYLRVKYTAGKSITPADAIYKQGSGSLEHMNGNGTITLKMRAPESDVDLSEIKFGLRGVNDDGAVLAKPLSELVDSTGDEMPALSTEWETFEISLSDSFEADEAYPNSTETVGSVPLLGIHIFAASETDTGTLDIASVEYSLTGNSLLNDFIGGDNVEATAKNANSATWWAGSSEGYIVKRSAKMEADSSFTVVKETVVGDFAYAVIEADGDIANLKVATTTDGESWGDAVAYDGYSVNLNGNEKGFKFIYEGEESVTVKRIYLTNVVVPVPAIAIPVIDAKTAQVMESFSVAQSGFTGDYDAMVAAAEAAGATDIWYRLSYQHGDKVEIKDGKLVFDGTETGTGDFIRFKFNTKHSSNGKYVVMKMKAEDGASLASFRFGLISESDPDGATVAWSHDWKAGVDLKASTAFDETNPYKASDGWFYFVIDIEESGLKTCESGYTGMEIFYQNVGKLYIDDIFFCDGVDVNTNIENDIEYNDAKLDIDATTSYVYNYMYVLNEGYGTTLEFDITPKEDNFDISNWRIGFQMNADTPILATLWGGENSDGSMITTDGKKLNELTYEKDKATHVVVDLVKSGIDFPFNNLHNHVDNIGGFTLTNVKLHTSMPITDIKELDTDKAFVVKDDNGTDNKVVTIAPTEGYAYVGYVGSLTDKSGQFSMDITVTDAADLANLRFEFTSGKTLWGSENAQGTLYTADGKMLSEVEFEAGVKKTVVIDLDKSGATLSDFYIHMGDSQNAITIENITVTPYIDQIAKIFAPKYAEQMALLPAYLDTVDPTVTITTATTAKAGDEITIAYTANDDLTSVDDLDITVSVKKDGNAVTVTGNRFTAEAGVYTVTVTVRDLAGNEASETIQITVSAADSGNDGGDGLSTGAIVGITVGCIAAVTVAGVAVYFVMKKKKNN